MTTRKARAPETAREVKFCALDLKKVALDAEFEGYASLFNREDLGHDIVLPGAFRETLSERSASGIKMLFQHDRQSADRHLDAVYARTHADFACAAD